MKSKASPLASGAETPFAIIDYMANFSIGMVASSVISIKVYGVKQDVDEKGNIVSMTIEHAKDNAGLSEFSYQEIPRQTS